MNYFFGKPWDEWVREYARGHQHPTNQLCHKYGIPMIVVSLPLLPLGLWLLPALYLGLVLFIVGWILQFVGHLAEKTWPEFFHDWRFLAVGTRWWWQKFGPTRLRHSQGQHPRP